jgi:hypothetical protein
MGMNFKSASYILQITMFKKSRPENKLSEINMPFFLPQRSQSTEREQKDMKGSQNSSCPLLCVLCELCGRKMAFYAYLHECSGYCSNAGDLERGI